MNVLSAVVLWLDCRDVLCSLMVKYYNYAIGLEKKAGNLTVKIHCKNKIELYLRNKSKAVPGQVSDV